MVEDTYDIDHEDGERNCGGCKESRGLVASFLCQLASQGRLRPKSGAL